MTRPLLERCAAEAAGTFLLVGIGTGAIVAAANAGGVSQWVMAIAWFGAVALPVLAFAFVSGSHINPAVTLSLVAARRFPPREALPYVGAQLVGAFAGSAVIWLVLGNAAHLGATLPRNGNLLATFALEFAFTALLILTVMFLSTPGKIPSRWELLLPAGAVGLSTWLIGPWTGSSLNPARTVAPAVLSGDYAGIWVYFLAVPLAALAVAVTFRKAAP
ncbi:MAG: aquaporin [Thermoplasmata archaeon]|nr:aquaporin [Thermoplasmata archaeon]